MHLSNTNKFKVKPDLSVCWNAGIKEKLYVNMINNIIYEYAENNLGSVRMHF